VTAEPTPTGVHFRAGKVNIEIRCPYGAAWVGTMVSDNGVFVKGLWPSEQEARAALFEILPELTAIADQLQAIRDRLPRRERTRIGTGDREAFVIPTGGPVSGGGLSLIAERES
jgi:hypothetical protein